jgi:hypothetical protein
MPYTNLRDGQKVEIWIPESDSIIMDSRPQQTIARKIIVDK